jgi:hypothetical protein
MNNGNNLPPGMQMPTTNFSSHHLHNNVGGLGTSQMGMASSGMLTTSNSHGHQGGHQHQQGISSLMGMGGSLGTTTNQNHLHPTFGHQSAPQTTQGNHRGLPGGLVGVGSGRLMID